MPRKEKNQSRKNTAEIGNSIKDSNPFPIFRNPLESETNHKNPTPLHEITFLNPVLFFSLFLVIETITMSSRQIRSRTAPASNSRKQLLLTPQSSSSSSSGSSRLAEVAGCTTAECAAICCCCPCGLVNLLYVAIYKVPAGLCRRALRNKRSQQLIKKGLLPPQRRQCSCGCDETEIQIHPVAMDSLPDIKSKEKEEEKEDESKKEVMKLEKEMWERFYSTGFWRSPSQRETPVLPTVNNCKN